MPSNDPENLTKIKFDNFEQCAFKVGNIALWTIVAYFGLFYLENLNSYFGFFNADRQSLGPNRDSENLKKIAIPRFEKNALKVVKNAFSTIFSRCQRP